MPWFFFLHLFAFLGTKLWGLESTVSGFRTLGRRVPRGRIRFLKPEVIWAKCQKSYRWLPFPIRCLDQALVIWYALNKAGYPAEMKIGMTTTPLESHAWVVCEGKVYVDIGNLDDFHVLNTYAPWNET